MLWSNLLKHISHWIHLIITIKNQSHFFIYWLLLLYQIQSNQVTNKVSSWILFWIAKKVLNDGQKNRYEHWFLSFSNRDLVSFLLKFSYQSSIDIQQHLFRTLSLSFTNSSLLLYRDNSDVIIKIYIYSK